MLSLKTYAVAAVLGTTLLSQHEAVAQSASLVPFDQFVQQVAAMPLAAAMSKPGAQVSDAASFEAMRSHVLALYNGVQVKHSFLLDAHPFDCVPTMQQPSVRLQHLPAIATPPSVGPAFPAAKGSSAAVASPSQVDAAQPTDPLGNTIGCESGAIPMRRVTLDDISKFKSLSAFFQKGPDGAGQYQRPDNAAPAVAASHKYAHSYQFVSNLGGTADIGLWNPKINTALSEIFSLNQFWYVNTSGPVQTLEGGVQNYPQKYNTTNSVLFIYWTSDGYNKVGCYNLDCPGFVQTNKNIYLGRGFSAYSTVGGAQYVVNLRAFHYQGNWWLYLGGGAAANAIGYYPNSVYHGTPMTVAANEIDYGGEVVGTTIWPPMGSGQFASTGYGHAAYDKNISYYPDATHFTGATLTPSQPSPRCYTDTTTNNSGVANWGTYFYFGGPGGSGC